MLEKIYQCNYCQKVLSGRVKATREEHSYISITGTVSLQLWDKESDYRSYLYVSNRPEANSTRPPQLFFCDTRCFNDYCVYKKKEHDLRRKEELMEEASYLATLPKDN